MTGVTVGSGVSGVGGGPGGGGSAALQVGKAVVETLETTTSATFTDLATPGPAVTINCPSPRALVIISANILNNTSNSSSRMAVDISGATTQAASSDRSLSIRKTEAGANPAQMQSSLVRTITDLTPGLNTFTAKYNTTNASTGTFLARTLVVIPLP